MSFLLPNRHGLPTTTKNEKYLVCFSYMQKCFKVFILSAAADEFWMLDAGFYFHIRISSILNIISLTHIPGGQEIVDLVVEKDDPVVEFKGDVDLQR